MRNTPPPLPMVANLQEAVALLENSRATPFLYSAMDIRVSESCTQPRMTLAQNVPVTPEFRAEINAWMLEFFGSNDHVHFLTNPVTGKQICVMSPRAAKQLLKAAPTTPITRGVK